MVTYLPPLSMACCAQLDPAAPGAAEEQVLAPLQEVLEAIPCADETMLVVGNMNGCTASRCAAGMLTYLIILHVTLWTL